jgi:hypothetical protein
MVGAQFEGQIKSPAVNRGALIDHRVEEKHVLGRPGSDLLFQAFRLSTIGAGKFNGRVRDGFGFSLSANTTRPAKNGYQRSVISNQKITNPNSGSKLISNQHIPI